MLQNLQATHHALIARSGEAEAEEAADRHGVAQGSGGTHPADDLLDLAQLGPALLGLMQTGPAAHKPASQVYRGLALLNGASDRLQVTAGAGVSVLAGRDPAGQRVVVALVVEQLYSEDSGRLLVALEALQLANTLD